jgi:septal ring factor EnvC (AmiA/AmiB activator)
MPNFGVVLKSEIARLSKKVVKAYVQPLQSSAASQRKQISAMKRQLSALEKEVTQLRKGLNRPTGSAAESKEEEGPALRFQARGLRSLRSRLGLSAEDFGKLVGVSGHSVYNR